MSEEATEPEVRRLTEEEKLRHIALEGERCPYCGSDDLTPFGLGFSDQGLRCTIQCQTCAILWVEYYQLTRIVELGEDGGEITDDEEDGDAEDCGD